MRSENNEIARLVFRQEGECKLRLLNADDPLGTLYGLRVGPAFRPRALTAMTSPKSLQPFGITRYPFSGTEGVER